MVRRIDGYSSSRAACCSPATTFAPLRSSHEDAPRCGQRSRHKRNGRCGRSLLIHPGPEPSGDANLALIYVKPVRGRVDIDADLITFALSRAGSGLDELVVVTSDLYRDHLVDGVEPLVALSRATSLTVLGFVEKSFSLNFSRGGAMILAQYYNFIRLGREGYTQIAKTMRDNARYLAKGIAAIGAFHMINDGTYTPCCCCSLKDESNYNAADVVQTLAQRGWIIPAFSMPPNAQSVNAMRMNVKETFSRDMADILIDDMKKAIAKLEATHRKPYHRVGTHHH